MKRSRAIGGIAVIAVMVGVAFLSPSLSMAQDARLKALVGTWEGSLTVREMRGEADRTLIMQERGGQLVGRFGITGKTLPPAKISVEFVEGSGPKISLTTSTGDTVTLSLIKEDLLSGSMNVVTVRGTRPNEVPLQMQRTKK